jgi:hypothetical protein
VGEQLSDVFARVNAILDQHDRELWAAVKRYKNPLERQKDRLAEFRTIALAMFQMMHNRPAETGSGGDNKEIVTLSSYLLWRAPMANIRDVEWLVKEWQTDQRYKRVTGQATMP